MDIHITEEFAKRKADELENMADCLTGWAASENGKDAAYWRGIQYVMSELKAGRVGGYTIDKGVE